MLETLTLFTLALARSQSTGSFSWEFEITDRAQLPAVNRPLGQPTFGEWSVLAFVDHPGKLAVGGHFYYVSCKDVQNAVGRVKKLLDTQLALEAMKAFAAFYVEDAGVSDMSSAVAASYVQHLMRGNKDWRSWHEKGLVSAKSVLARAANQSTRGTFGLAQGIACIVLARMSGDPAERKNWFGKVVASVPADDEFLGLAALLELCRDELLAKNYLEVQRLAKDGVKRYRRLQQFENFRMLDVMSVNPHVEFTY